ncbi:Sec7 domain containing protein [Histomonas meleagridis]|uniref:Sec7 domain containing protein n=1 Tax=Histomonas meleagridis TaxID=135588 RepID=UPI00355A6602|nr:Sec7 domain containing protein [Histomonas meleagridis]KAH0804462.1 Sec7 domain containing protein [Histomonas meleagridis]
MSELNFGIPDEILQEIEDEDKTQPAIFAFNSNPKIGINDLCHVYNVNPDPENIAHLLHTVDGLLGDKIGEYLSRRGNSEILLAYFDEIKMDGPIIDALRKALSSSLHLPKEGEQIDRILQGFAKAYVKQNPDVKIESDQVYILSYALILLNSDLHNPKVPKHMTQDEFIENIRGAMDQETISDKQLIEMYHVIKSQPFAMKRSSNADTFALSAPRMKGELQKKTPSHWFARFRPKYFVLTNSSLYYFNNIDEVGTEQPKGLIQLEGVNVTMAPENVIVIQATEGQLQCVKFTPKGPEMQEGITQIELKAKSEVSRDKWFYRIKTSAVFSNFNQNDNTKMDLSSSALGNEVSDSTAAIN